MAESVCEVERNRNNKIRLMSENGGFLSAKSEKEIGEGGLTKLNRVFYLGNVEGNSYNRFTVNGDEVGRVVNRASEFCPDVDELDYKGICTNNDETCGKKRCSDRYDSSESSDSGIAVSSSASSGTSDITDPGSPFSTSSDDSTSSPGKCKVVVGERCKSEEKSPSWSEPSGRCRSEEKTWRESWEEKRAEGSQPETEKHPDNRDRGGEETDQPEEGIREKEEPDKTDPNSNAPKTDYTKMAPNVPSSASSPCDVWASMTGTNTANDTATHFNHFDETQSEAITIKRLIVDGKESNAPLNINNNILVNVPSLILSEIEPDLADNKRKSRNDNCEGPKVKMRRPSHDGGKPSGKGLPAASDAGKQPKKNGMMTACEKIVNGVTSGNVKPKTEKNRHQGKITEYFKSQIKSLVGLKRDFGVKKDSMAGTWKGKPGTVFGQAPEEEPPAKKAKGDEKHQTPPPPQQQQQQVSVFVKPSPKPPQTILPLMESARLLSHLSKLPKAADFLLSKPAGGTKTLFNKILQNHKNRKLAESYLKCRMVLKPKPSPEAEVGPKPNNKDASTAEAVQNKNLECNSFNVMSDVDPNKILSSGKSNNNSSSNNNNNNNNNVNNLKDENSLNSCKNDSSSSDGCSDSSSDVTDKKVPGTASANYQVISNRLDKVEAKSSPSLNSPILSAPKTIRFPAVCASSRTEKQGTQAREVISCRWNACSVQSDSASGLLEHLQTAHVLTQVSGEKFVCLWFGCKVFDQKSCSRTWLERHVLSHAGSKPFRCIVDGCGQGFSTQAILERHVNSHFAADVKKALDSSIAHKLFRRNGKKLRYRRQPWSARMFDFFDSGIMEGLEHRLVKLTQVRTGGDITEISGKSLALTSQVIARRMTENGKQQFLVRWSPPNIIDDEWLYENEVTKKKIISIPSLSPSVSSSLQETFELVTKSSQTYRTGRRKNKGTIVTRVPVVELAKPEEPQESVEVIVPAAEEEPKKAVEPILPPPKTVPVRNSKSKPKKKAKVKKKEETSTSMVARVEKKEEKPAEETPIAALSVAAGPSPLNLAQDACLTTEKTVSLRPKESVPAMAPLPEELTMVPVCPPPEEVVPVQPGGIFVDNTKLIQPIKTEMIVGSPLKLVAASQYIEQPFVQAVMPVQMPVTYQIPIVKLSQASGMFFPQMPNYIIPPSPAMLPTPQIPAFRNGFHFSTGGTIQFQASSTTLQQTASGFMQSTNSSGFQIVHSPATTNLQQSVLTAFQNSTGIATNLNLKSPTLRFLNCQPLILNNAKPLANISLTLTNVSSMAAGPQLAAQPPPPPAPPPPLPTGNPLTVSGFPGMAEPPKTGHKIVSAATPAAASPRVTPKKLVKPKLNILPKPSLGGRKSGGVVEGTKGKKQCLQPCGPSAAAAASSAT